MRKQLIFLLFLIGTIGCKKDTKPLSPKQVIKITVSGENSSKVTEARITIPGYITDGKINADGKYTSMPLEPNTYKVSVSAKGFITKEQDIRVNKGIETESDFLLLIDSPITFQPKSVTNFNSNDKNQHINITNSGSRGAIKLEITPPAAQWLIINPPDLQLTIPANKTVSIPIHGEAKGLAPNNYSTTLYYSFSSLEDKQYESRGTYEIGMSVLTSTVTTKPLITDFFPTSGGFDTKITINGQNFETDTSKIQVFFGDKKATAIPTFSKNRIEVIVPKGAKTGKIRIQAGDEVDFSNTEFEYKLTYVVKEIATLNTKLFINDLTSSPNGDIYLAGISANGDVLVKNGLYRVPKNAFNETTLIEKETGFKDGALNEALIVNPTKITFFSNSLYFLDQFDANIYKSNVETGFTSLRKLENSSIKTLFSGPLTNKEFVHDVVNVSKSDFNGLLFSDGIFYKYDVANNKKTSLSIYQGLTTQLSFDGTYIYSLDLEPENNPTTWKIRKRELSTDKISNPTILAERPLGKIGKENYPKGMALDIENKCIYLFDNNSNDNYNIFKVSLEKNAEPEIIYSGTKKNVFENGVIGKGASFKSISCITYDDVNKRILFVDVSNSNTIRAIECL